jgi:thymidylate synthase (FAD)
MKVELLAYTPEKIGMALIARMARSTRQNELLPVADDKKNAAFIEELLNVKHEGVLEHITFTFHVSEISRCLTHQLVRHRIASYLQQSGRHVMPRKQDYVIPPTIAHNVHTVQHYKEYMEWQWDNVQRLLNMGTPKEDARYALPDGYYTHISITMNARSLKHLFQLRCEREAQWEIREMAEKLLVVCHEKYPVLFEEEYKMFIKEKEVERMPLGDAQKPKCPNCKKVLKLEKDRLKCDCGYECGKHADICCCCGVVLDEDH